MKEQFMPNTKKYLRFRPILIFLFPILPAVAQVPGKAPIQSPGNTPVQISGKTLTLPEAWQIATANYQLLQAKVNYAKASAQAIQTAKKDALPDFTLAAENAYGTLNGMNGLSSGETGLTTLTSGPVTSTQGWNAAFGALYVSNINWNIYSFGLQRSHVAVARGQNNQDLADLRQEQFRQQVRVAGAYLDLLSAQRLRLAMEDNLLRASQLRDIILRRTEGGLNPGVDSSIANAEVSRARLTLIDAQNYEQTQANQLSIQLGIAPQSFVLDSSFAQRLPGKVEDEVPASISRNPILQFMDSRVKTSDLQADYIHRTGLPRFSLFGVLQDRGSGFGGNYASNQNDYSAGYFNGVNPIRTNYLVGVGATWDVTDLGKARSKVVSQRYLSSALSNEYNLEQNQLTGQLALANQQIRNALSKYRETPVQLRSATDAYGQKEALYENGLTTLVDLAQTLFILNRAEIDRDIACTAVWQALLLKAGAVGDMDLFLQQL
jgi:outer membrane protein TolC